MSCQRHEKGNGRIAAKRSTTPAVKRTNTMYSRSPPVPSSSGCRKKPQRRKIHQRGTVGQGCPKRLVLRGT
jgi:hypothetical protein